MRMAKWLNGSMAKNINHCSIAKDINVVLINSLNNSSNNSFNLFSNIIRTNPPEIRMNPNAHFAN